MWENRRLLDASEDGDDRSFLEELVRARASRSLAHVFTLLALVLPTEPLRIAFRGLHTDDQALRGTALEYLDSVLPHEIRDRLWLFLEDRRLPGKVRRPREETLGDLLRSTRLDQAEPRRTEATRRRSQEHLMTAEARAEAAIPVRRRDRQHLLLRTPRRRIGSSSESTTRSGSNRALRRTSTESSPWVLVAAEDKMSLGRRFPAPGLAQSQLAKPRRLLDH